MAFKQRRIAEASPASPAADKQDIFAYIATPAYDGRVLTDYAISLAESIQAATMLGIKVATTVMGNGAFIDLARNSFVRMFLESKCTHLFFIDADLKWEAYGFVGLLCADKEICAGVYPKRQTPEAYPVYYAPHPTEGGLWVEDSWINCFRVPTGFLCIRRDVVELMWNNARVQKLNDVPEQRRIFYTKDTPEGSFVGEDYTFCDDYCRITGKTIPVWPDINFTHGQYYKGNWHEFLSRAPEDPSHPTTQPGNQPLHNAAPMDAHSTEVE